jgi:predicted ATPase
MTPADERSGGTRDGGHPIALSVGNLVMDTASRQAWVGDRELNLTFREFELLRHLAEHVGWVFSPDQLLSDVWGYKHIGDARVVSVHIRNLRMKLGATPFQSVCIETVRGAGYRLARPDRAQGPASASTESLSGGSHSRAAPFVGRENELRSALEALEAAQNGRGSVILMTGELGIGKTTLARALAEEAKNRGAIVLWAHCRDAGTQSPYGPWAQVLRALAVSCSGQELSRLLRPCPPELAVLVPELAQYCEERSPVPTLQDGAARARLVDGILGPLRNAAAGHALVLVFDDLDSCDEDSLRVLHVLAAEAVRTHLLVVATMGDSEKLRHQFLRDALAILAANGSKRMPLHALTAEETAELVTLTVGERPSPDIAEAIYRQSEGNPFFARECAQLFAGDGGVANNPAATAAHDMPLSPDTRDIVGGRLTGLSDECREVLGLAALVGRSFDVRLLWGASGMDMDHLLELLDEALEKGLIKGEETPGRFRLSHPMFRQVLIADLGDVRRLALHQRIAHALEQSADPGTHVAEIAHHLNRSSAVGDAGKALEYARRAGVGAMGQLGFEEAARHFQQAHDLLPLVELDPQARRDTAVELRESVGDAFFGCGRTDDAIAAYQQCLPLLPAGTDRSRARIYRKMGNAWQADQKPSAALECFKAAESALVGQTDARNSEEWCEWIEIQLGRIESLYSRADLPNLAATLEAVEEAALSYGTEEQQSRLAVRRLTLTSGRERSLLSRGVSSPLVGREMECLLLRDTLERLAMGEGAILSVTGEAGMGKSRLIVEARSRSEGRSFRWLEGRALSYGQSISYWPFLEILSNDVGFDLDDTEGSRRKKLTSRAADLFGDRADSFLPYLAALLNVNLPDDLTSGIESLDAESIRQQIFRSIHQYLSAAAGQCPLVLVLEDVQWMDQSSTALAEHLIPLTRRLPLLVLLVGRSDRATPVRRLVQAARSTCSDRVIEIDLSPLSREHCEALVANLVGEADVPSGLLTAWLRRAEGNPFFLEEIIRTLIDFGGLSDADNGGWRIMPTSEEIILPDTLDAVIMARIDRLDDDLKQVLQLAAVIGISFLYRVLGTVTKDAQGLVAKLKRLETHQLIREDRRSSGIEYVFKHALVQQSVYDSTLPERRSELHQRVATAIEGLFSAHLDDYHSLLAYHYSRAGNWEKAQEYLLKAGNQAAKIAADAEALAYYRKALTAYGQLFGDRWDPVERATMERKMGEALFRLGSHEEARTHLLHGLAVLGCPLPRSRSALMRGSLRQVLVQAGHRLLPGVLWKRRGSMIDGHAEELCLAFGVLVWIDNFGAPESVLFEGLQGLNLGEKIGAERTVIKGLFFATVVCLFAGVPRLALRYSGSAIRRAEQTRQPLDLSDAHLARGYTDFALGRCETALEHFRLAAENALHADYLYNASSALGITSLILRDQGKLRQVLDIQTEMLRVTEEAGAHHLSGISEGVIGDALNLMGLLREAEDHHRRALHLTLQANDLADALLCHADLAHNLSRQGRFEEAVQALRDARRLVEANPRIRLLYNTHYQTYTAEINLLLLEQGRGLNGELLADGESNEETWQAAVSACKQARKSVKLYRGAAVSAYRSQGTYEWLRGRPRRAEKWWRKSVAASHKTGLDYQLGLTYLEMGKRLKDRARVEAAADIFRRSEAGFDLQEADAILATLP